METLQLSEIKIPPSKSRLLIVTQGIPIDSAMLVRYLNNLLDTNEITNKIISALEINIGFIQITTYSTHFTFVKPFHADSSLFNDDLMDFTYLQQICKQTNTDIVLIIKEIKPELRVAPYEFEYLDELDMLVIEKQYGINSSLKIEWVLTDPFNEVIIDTYKSAYKKLWQYGEYTQKGASVYVSDSLAFFKIAGYESGSYYGKRIMPYWRKEERLIFCKGNEEMKKAFLYANENKWSDAIEIWNSQLNNKNIDVAAQAAYNLAVASELSGVLWKARMWALRSFRMNGNLEAAEYANLLFEKMQYYEKWEE